MPQLKADSSHLPDTLSPQARVCLLTCAPGAELYSIFGHSSIRIFDPAQRLDWVFNFGTFDFDTPNFALKFARGKLEYYLLSYSMRGFMREYQADSRTVREQVLNLDAQQREAILKTLKANERPENRFYKYDFFFDNCSSRERDILQQVLGNSVTFQSPSGVDYGSYRSLITPYMEQIPWTAFGIHLMLGTPADQIAGVKGAVFLPDHLHDIFGASKVKTPLGESPLVLEEKVLLQAEPVIPPSGWFTPWVVLGLVSLTGLGIYFLPVRFSALMQVFDSILFGVVGLLGCLMLTFWLATDHQATYGNLNLMWALPSHLFLSIGVWIKRWQPAVRAYSKFGMVSMLLFLLGAWVLPQGFPGPIFPLVAMMAFRLYTRLGLPKS